MFFDNDDCWFFLGVDLSDLDVKKVKHNVTYISHIGTDILSEKVKKILQIYVETQLSSGIHCTQVT